MGYLMLAYGIGTFIGPKLGGFLAVYFSVSHTPYVATLLSLSSFGIISIFIKDSKKTP